MDPFFSSIPHAEAIVAKLKRRIPRAIADHRLKKLTAKMFGHLDWDRLVASSDRPNSPFDDECDDATRKARRLRSAAALVEFGFEEAASERLVDEIRPTARTKMSGKTVTVAPSPVPQATSKDAANETDALLEALISAALGDRSRHHIVPAPRTPSNGKRSVTAKASVPRNAVFRGISITVIKAILKLHASWWFPEVVETAARSAISLDVRTTLGLHEELMSCGFLARGAGEKKLEAYRGYDQYSRKPAHITDKGKSIFTPGTRYMLPPSDEYDPATPVDLTWFPDEFAVCDVTWFNGRISVSSSIPYNPQGLIHTIDDDPRKEERYDINTRVLSSYNHYPNAIEEANAFDGRSKFGLCEGAFEENLPKNFGIVDRTYSENNDVWTLSLSLIWKGKREKPFRYDWQSEIETHRDVTLQSILITVVAADLWRLAHRRQHSGVEATIRAVINIQNSEALRPLRTSMNALVDKTTDFVSHLAPEYRHDIEIVMLND